MYKEWIKTDDNIEEAIKYAWDNQAVLIIYPNEMDSIVVCEWTEELCYLSARTLILNTEAFESKKVFEDCARLQVKMIKEL